ncbi:MAG: PKD domain-containing protein [Methanoregulaceae archaeon]
MQIKVKPVITLLILSIILLCGAGEAAQVFSTTIPISFIQNDGQTDDQVLYYADAAGYTVYLTPSGEVISTAEPHSVLTISYTGSRAPVTVTPEDELAGKANFLIGFEDAWVTGVPMYGSVRYDGLYEGISLVYHGGPGILKKEFILEPGADPSAIVMQYLGQERIALDENGALLVSTNAGTFIESPPVCYQVVNGDRADVACEYTIDEGIVTFAVGPYDAALPLVIDPQYDFSTYLGGTRDDKGAGIGMDDWGNVYVVGSTQSTQFPLSNGPIYQEHLNGSWDIFVTKFGPDQPDGPVYSTYIGGYSDDLAGGMVVSNDTGIVTFTGSTKSWNYPTYSTVGPDVYGGNTDAIVTRLNADGDALIWSRILYGNKTDVGTAIALDDYIYNDVVVVGYTSSDNLTDWGFTDGPVGGTDGFVLKIWNDGVTYDGRYLGGDKNDYAYGVEVEKGSGFPDIWVTGSTKSLNFPTSGGAFRHANFGEMDAFVTRLDWDLNIKASTYLGGSGNDVGTAIAVDRDLYPYITGYTESPVSPISLFPIRPLDNAFQKTFGGGQWDAFVTKMEPDLSRINYSTYLGGLYDEKAYGIAVDANGTAFVTGYTNSENFPTKYPIQATKGLGYLVPDAFITQVNQTGTGLLFSTYLGGTYYDEGAAIAVTDDGKTIAVTGYTESVNFPIQNALQPYLSGFSAVRFTDAFVTKIVKLTPVANFTGDPVVGCTPLTVYFTDTSTNNPTSWFWEFGDGSNSTEQNPNHTYVNTNLNAAKNFTVNLTACNIEGCNTTSKINFTKVCPQPFADFIASPTQGCLNWSNTTIQFNLTADSGGVRKGPALKWNWSFGDGNYSLVNYTNVNVTHTYTTMNGTDNFTVTLTYENACCNNTTVKEYYIDIRDKPNASFYAIPTIGLIPLHVNFFDNSTGRPSNWTWTFGAGQGGSTDQNPEHTYSTKGAYNVKLTACNFCGCDSETQNKYIKAGVPNLTFAAGTTMVLPNGDIIVPTNDTTPLRLYLEEAPNGISGYDITALWGDSVHGDIMSVAFPWWAANTSVTTLPNYSARIKALDLGNGVNPGDTNQLLATFNLKGNISTFSSTIDFKAIVNRLDDDGVFGPVDTHSVPATISVVRLLPFPGISGHPTDPDGDQKYWDVNGNGEIDFNDVITYFLNMDWIESEQYIPFFDYNGNSYIDFNDVILLFHEV